MELNHLRYFYDVAKAGSFTEAARQLRISQSALSKTVALLEDREGAKLLYRSKRGVSLTSLGAEVFAKCEAIFRSVDEIQNTMRGTREICEGSFRFGASDHIANYLLVEKLQKLRAAHPLLVPSVFTATSNELVALLLRGELELALFFTKVNTSGVVYEPIGNFPMAIVCHPKLLGQGKKKSLTPKMEELIAKAGFISSIKKDYQKHPSQTLFDLVFAEPTISYECNSQEMQKRLCLAGGGIAFLARFMVEKEIEAGELVEIQVKKPVSLEIFIAKQRGRALSINARTFLEAISDHS